MNLKEYISKSGEILLYHGNPNLAMLELLSNGAGDIWHSSFEQGYKNAFPELMYQTAVFFWYLNDFDDLEECVSWRINPNAFAVRKSVWELTNGFDLDYTNPQMQAIDFGFICNRFLGIVPLYVKNLFQSEKLENVEIAIEDRHIFFRKNYNTSHAYYMIFRLGFWKIAEWKSFRLAKNKYQKRKNDTINPPRKLIDIQGNPTVSYIIPTMFRQEFTLQLLKDLENQNYKPNEVVVVDATPSSECDENFYTNENFSFELKIIGQKSKGSCRARNEALALCSGDYIVFGDDDIRIPEDFIENHIKLLQTYGAGACNGLDIRADHYKQDLNDLKNKISKIDNQKRIVGCAQMFSNANSCVKREHVVRLVGNDVNFDGGYGEDSDFGMSLSKIGVTVLSNPFSINLHLKPPSGGYRFWGKQAKIIGKKRKSQPWELEHPVKWVKPVPSPTVMYGILKHYNKAQLKEYKYKHFLHYLTERRNLGVFYSILRIPYKIIQFEKSIFYAQNLKKLGVRHK